LFCIIDNIKVVLVANSRNGIKRTLRLMWMKPDHWNYGLDFAEATGQQEPNLTFS
jgi:hypothetical protein